MAIMLINNKELNVVQMNSKGEKTIIMIHGLFTSLAIYYFTIAPRLAKKYHIVLYDLCGHGLSETSKEVLTPKSLSEDLVALMSALRIKKACLVGYSFGGGVALYTALSYPHLVERLAVIDMPDLNEEGFESLLSNEVNFKKEIENHIHSLNINIPKQVNERTMRRLNEMFGNGKLTTILNTSRQILDELPKRELKTPILLLYGRKSPYLETGKRLYTEVSNAHLHIGRGDHNIPIQSPLWIFRHLRRFLS